MRSLSTGQPLSSYVFVSGPVSPLRLILDRSNSVQAMSDGLSNEELFQLTKIDPWWLSQLRELFDIQTWARTKKLTELGKEDMNSLKSKGFSDSQIARYTGGWVQFASKVDQWST